MAEPEAYEREIRIEASPQTVFALLVDPEGLTSWMGEEASLDPRPGGEFRVAIGPARVAGTYVEVVEPERVVITWGWEGDAVPLAPGASRVEFDLMPDGEATILRLRHTGLTARLREFHDWGWSAFIPRLAAVAEGRHPGPDPMTTTTVEQLLAILRGR